MRLTKSGKPDMRYKANKELFGTSNRTSPTSHVRDSGYTQQRHTSRTTYTVDPTFDHISPIPSPQKSKGRRSVTSFGSVGAVDPMLELEGMLNGLHISQPSERRTAQQTSDAKTKTETKTKTKTKKAQTEPLLDVDALIQPKVSPRKKTPEKTRSSRKTEASHECYEPGIQKSKSNVSTGALTVASGKTSEPSVRESLKERSSSDIQHYHSTLLSDHPWYEILLPPEHLTKSSQSTAQNNKKETSLKENKDDVCLVNTNGSPDRRRKESKTTGKSITADTRTENIRDHYGQQKFRKEHQLTDDQHAAHVIGLGLKLDLIKLNGWNVTVDDAKKNQDLVVESSSDNLVRDKAIDGQILAGTKEMLKGDSDSIKLEPEARARLGAMIGSLKKHIDDNTATEFDRSLYKQFNELQICVDRNQQQ